eukprot:3451450-Amphidinium_carterae.1
MEREEGEGVKRAATGRPDYEPPNKRAERSEEASTAAAENEPTGEPGSASRIPYTIEGVSSLTVKPLESGEDQEWDPTFAMTYSCATD